MDTHWFVVRIYLTCLLHVCCGCDTLLIYHVYWVFLPKKIYWVVSASWENGTHSFILSNDSVANLPSVGLSLLHLIYCPCCRPSRTSLGIVMIAYGILLTFLSYYWMWLIFEYIWKNERNTIYRRGSLYHDPNYHEIPYVTIKPWTPNYP